MREGPTRRDQGLAFEFLWKSALTERYRAEVASQSERQQRGGRGSEASISAMTRAKNGLRDGDYGARTNARESGLLPRGRLRASRGVAAVRLAPLARRACGAAALLRTSTPEEDTIIHCNIQRHISPDATRHDQARPHKTRPQTRSDQTRQNATKHDRTTPDRCQTTPGTTEHCQTTLKNNHDTPYGTRRHRTTPDNTKRHQTTPDQAKPDKTRPDHTKPNRARPDHTIPDGMT